MKHIKFVPNKTIINNCKIQNSYTIMSNNIISDKPFINVKKALYPGSIIVIDVNNELNKEFEDIIDYILSKGYIIKSLEEGLKE